MKEGHQGFSFFYALQKVRHKYLYVYDEKNVAYDENFQDPFRQVAKIFKSWRDLCILRSKTTGSRTNAKLYTAFTTVNTAIFGIFNNRHFFTFYFLCFPFSSHTKNLYQGLPLVKKHSGSKRWSPDISYPIIKFVIWYYVCVSDLIGLSVQKNH